MKTNPSEAPSSGALQKRGRRTFAEAASQFARSMVQGTLGASARGRDEPPPPVNSAAASVHRLRKVLERDRVNCAEHEPEISEISAVVLAALDEQVTELERFSEPERVCETCGAPELPFAARTQRPRAQLRLPPPPPPRRVAVFDFAVEDQDEDAWPSVHDEPTRVSPPPAAIMDRADTRASALAAAAASAFGSAVGQ